MSTDTTNTNSAVTTTDADTASNPGMGGTNTDGDAGAGDAEGAEIEHESAEGESPETQEQRGEEPAKPQREEPSSRLTEAEEQAIADASFVSRIVQSDPELLRAFEASARRQRGEEGTEDRLSKAIAARDKFFRDTDDNPANTALREITEPLIAEIRDLRRTVTQMRPQVQRAHQAAATGEFQRGLVTNGLPANVLSDPKFLAFLTEQRRDRNFQSDEASRPAYAAKNLANAWKAKGGQARVNANLRASADAIRNKPHNGSGPSGSGATKVYVKDTSDPSWDTKLLMARIAASERGETLNVVNKKK